MKLVKKYTVILLIGTLVYGGAGLVGEKFSVPVLKKLVSTAEARRGRPLTPVSVAGVGRRTARRTSRRVVAVSQ